MFVSFSKCGSFAGQEVIFKMINPKYDNIIKKLFSSYKKGEFIENKLRITEPDLSNQSVKLTTLMREALLKSNPKGEIYGVYYKPSAN